LGLILDSSVVIAAERRGDVVEAFIEEVVSSAGDQAFPDLLIGVTALELGSQSSR
jgi:hypothetical protein